MVYAWIVEKPILCLKDGSAEYMVYALNVLKREENPMRNKIIERWRKRRIEERHKEREEREASAFKGQIPLTRWQYYGDLKDFLNQNTKTPKPEEPKETFITYKEIDPATGKVIQVKKIPFSYNIE